jgi:hypothetical protein
MSALESTRITRSAIYHGSPACELCKAERRQHSSFAARQLWVLGRPLLRVCRKHDKDAQAIWKGAL